MGRYAEFDAGAVFIPELGWPLFALALEWANGESPRTKAERMLQVRILRGPRSEFRGSHSLPAVYDGVRAVAELIERQRKIRRRRRQRDELSSESSARLARLLKEAVSDSAMRTQPLEARLRERIGNSVKAHYPHDAAANSKEDLAVSVVTDPTAVGYTQTCEAHSTAPSRTTRTASCRHEICVTRRWLNTVSRRGLTVLDNRLTLEASRLERTQDEVEVYLAIWTEENRLHEIKTVRGYIAVTRQANDAIEAVAHGRTLRGALLRLRVKTGKAEPSVQTAPCPDKLASSALDLEGIEVSTRMLSDIGRCPHAFRSWCHALGIELDHGACTLAEVYEGYERAPSAEVRRLLEQAPWLNE